MAPAVDVETPPSGQNYKVACIALDLTGRKMIDEIVCIGGYCYPDNEFTQYVMPHRDVSRSSTRAYGIRVVINFGRFRALKDLKTMKTLKTKSEYSTLTDFLEWLKNMKGSSDGLLLAYYDNKNQTVTPFLMEALARYRMTDEFFEVVKGFICTQDIAEEHAEVKSKSVSTLRALAKRLLQLEDNTGDIFHCAKDRARIIYQLLQKMTESDSEINSASVMKYASSQTREIENLENQRALAQKVRSLRPIFASKIRRGLKDRNRAVSLRRYLIDAKVDMEDLSKAYETGEREAVAEVVSQTQAKKKDKDMEELIEMIVTFFKDGGSKRDMNGNVKNIGQGDGQPNGASTSSTETDEDEFEEAKE